MDFFTVFKCCTIKKYGVIMWLHYDLFWFGFRYRWPLPPYVNVVLHLMWESRHNAIIECIDHCNANARTKIMQICHFTRWFKYLHHPAPTSTQHTLHTCQHVRFSHSWIIFVCFIAHWSLWHLLFRHSISSRFFLSSSFTFLFSQK